MANKLPPPQSPSLILVQYLQSIYEITFKIFNSFIQVKSFNFFKAYSICGLAFKNSLSLIIDS